MPFWPRPPFDGPGSPGPPGANEAIAREEAFKLMHVGFPDQVFAMCSLVGVRMWSNDIGLVCGTPKP